MGDGKLNALHEVDGLMGSCMSYRKLRLDGNHGLHGINGFHRIYRCDSSRLSGLHLLGCLI